MRRPETVSPGVRVVFVLFLFGLSGTLNSAPASDKFDHESHGSLFDSCGGCHQPGLSGMYTIDQSMCNECHDGNTLASVEWTRPTQPARNLRFDHLDHPLAYLEEGDELECGECHQASPGDKPMAFHAPAARSCLNCHDEDPNAHFTPGTPCSSCHLSLSEAGTMLIEGIADFPEPEAHRSDEFLRTHGVLAAEHLESCATCHARESCERCHINAAQISVIGNLARDGRVASLMEERKGTWPVPEFHANPSWPTTHGGSASATNCATCHQNQFCTDCHQGEQNMDRAAGGYHPPNFVAHHAASAYSSVSECSACHSTEVFCRDCHQQSGLSPAASRGNIYHDARPMWLLSHGEAARQELGSCVSCHQQSDCLQCHSARSGWRISPHGPDFASDALRGANRRMCLTCHPRSFFTDQ